MRKKFDIQYQLGTTPIERLELPLDSRDELPPVLRALQYIYTDAELNEKVFSILENKVTCGLKRTGRPGMSLWEILVFATIRLALDCDYDRLQHIANYDSLVRSFVGISNFGENLKRYSLQSLKDNIRLLDEQTINQISQLVAYAGHQLLNVGQDDQQLDVKVDSYVLETNVHFPTDLNLLWDAARKCVKLTAQLSNHLCFSGWRQYKRWLRQLKRAYHRAAKKTQGKGKTTASGLETVLDYLQLCKRLSDKLNQMLSQLANLINTDGYPNRKLEQLYYFKEQLDKQIDLVRRRLIYKQAIPHQDKVFSLFEPYTRWIKRGKTRAEVELGVPIAVATDQYGFILDHYVMEKEVDAHIAVSFSEQILAQWSLNSLSFDKGFWSPQNYLQLKDKVAHLIMPKKGRLSQTDKQRQQNKQFKQLQRYHAAIESDINCLEHHGLNRCPDKTLTGFKRYAALGILAYNLHKLGNILLAADRKAA